MSKNFDVISLGGAVEDIIFYTDKGKIIPTPQDLTAQRVVAFEYGAKINAKEIAFGVGGGAANSAVAFARLGLKTAVIARLGLDDAGQKIRRALKKEKVNTDYLQGDSAQRTGFSLIVVVDKRDYEHVLFANRGANERLVFNPAKYNRLDCRWLHVTSLSGADWLKNLKAIFAFAGQQNIKVSWNPGNLQLQAGKKVLAGFLRATQVLSLNKDEAIELVISGIKLGRKNPNYLNRPLYLLNILQEWGPKIVVITDGPKGAWVYDGKKIYHQKIFKSKVINTLGVGDAFNSGFLAGLMVEKNNIGSALKWGMANSSTVVSKAGAQAGLLSRSELLKKINHR